MSLVPTTPNLDQSAEESWLGALKIPEWVITQVVKRVGEKSTPPGHEFVCTPETYSEMKFKQLPPTPHMSSIIRSKIQSTESIPHFPLSETKLIAVLDETKDITLELLINSTEIYLAWEELSQNKENNISSSEPKFGKGSKGNMLKAPYKDRQCGIQSKPQTTSDRSFPYKDPKESLFFKERMARVKKLWD